MPKQKLVFVLEDINTDCFEDVPVIYENGKWYKEDIPYFEFAGEKIFSIGFASEGKSIWKHSLVIRPYDVKPIHAQVISAGEVKEECCLNSRDSCILFKKGQILRLTFTHPKKEDEEITFSFRARWKSENEIRRVPKFAEIVFGRYADLCEERGVPFGWL